MKLKKILAAALAGVMAMTSTVFTASANERLPLTTWTSESGGGSPEDYTYTIDPSIASTVASVELTFADVTTDYLQPAVIVDAGHNNTDGSWNGNYNACYDAATITGSTASLTVDFAAKGLAYRAEDTKTNLIIRGNYMNAGSASLMTVVIKDANGDTLVSLVGDVADTTEYSWQTLEVPTVDEYNNYYFPGYFVTDNINGPNAGIEIVTVDNDSTWGGFNVVNSEGSWTKITGDFGDTTTGTITTFIKFSDFTGDLPTTGGKFVISTYGGATVSSVRIKNAAAKEDVYVVPAPTYNVTVDSAIENGTVTVDKATAAEGDTVTVTATPAEGYELDTITVNGEAITGTTFEMPAKDTTVSATFKEKAAIGEGGTAEDEVFDKAAADFVANKVVTQTKTTADGTESYRFVMKISEADAKANNKVTFTISNGTKEVTKDVTTCYKEIVASGEAVSETGYVYVAYTVTDVPANTTLTATAALSK